MADIADVTADRMEAEGFLRKLSKEEASELFGTNATVYRINKTSFFEA